MTGYVEGLVGPGVDKVMRSLVFWVLATIAFLVLFKGLGYEKMNQAECRDALIQQILEHNGWEFYLTTPRVDWSEEEIAIHANAAHIVKETCVGLSEAGVVRVK